MEGRNIFMKLLKSKQHFLVNVEIISHCERRIWIKILESENKEFSGKNLMEEKNVFIKLLKVKKRMGG